MKKVLLCVFCILSLFLFSGCTNQNPNEVGIYETEVINELSEFGILNSIDKQKVYLTDNQWKIEHNSNSKVVSNIIDLFNGENEYTIAQFGNKYFAVRSKNYTDSEKQQKYAENPVYALLNWDTYNPYNQYTNFNDNVAPRKIGKTKSKYGFDCTLYEYNWQDCRGRGCSDVSRKVCVNEKNNMAVSIQTQFYENANKNQRFVPKYSLELIKYERLNPDTDIFDISAMKNITIIDENTFNNLTF